MEFAYSLDDYATFTGTSVDAEYEDLFDELLSQAGDLFELATGRSELPGDLPGVKARAVRRGVLAMTEALLAGQPFRELAYSPLRNETIGSYSYSLQEKISVGMPTNVAWFDLAVSLLDTEPSISTSSISAFDRPGDLSVHEGRTYLPGPNDRHRDGGIRTGDEPREGVYGRRGGI